jgi:cell division transport system permease protein
VSRRQRRLRFAARASRRGIARNRLAAAAASLTMALMLVLLGGAYIASATLDAASTWATGKIQVVAYLRDDADAADAARITRAVESLAGVSTVRSLDAETALAEFRERLAIRGEPDLTGSVPGNPIPASVEVTMADAAATATVAESMRADAAVERVVDLAGAAARIAGVAGAARLAGFAAFAAAGLVALLVVNAAIRLAVAARREELEIMRLVGASEGFIRLPFLLEGAAFGLTGALTAIALVVAGALLAGGADGVPAVLDLPLRATLAYELVALLLIAGIVVGVTGSGLATRGGVRRT